MNLEKKSTLQSRLAERYASIVDNLEDFRNYINQPLKQSFRINSLKGEHEKILTNLKKYDGTIASTKWYDNGFTTELENLGSSIEHFTGQIYIQELTSMMPALAIPDIDENKRIIDCCAAPGSKTTQIAEMMNNQGEIIANDNKHSRLKALRGNLDRLGITNTTVTLRDFRSFPNTEADIYFVDAPCSSEGTIRKKNTIRRKWNDNDYKRFTKTQEGILERTCEMASKGDQIIYSTCTFAPEENEHVVNAILETQSIKLKNINIKNLKTGKGLTSWKNHTYDKELQKCARIWPHHNDTDGFFIARIEKC
ncbi:MAG: RsmB/NOP family class I SAM-dependent RNA methyltransferase [Candidatus Poseidoniia archaeon]|nr:RsmB/NOP family class I SAM-dependent RNA methyltransferase [Candidatus Poseidoniia archaeon]